MECLDETTVLALLAGELPDDDATRRRAHLAECDECRAVVAEMARSPAAEDGPAFAATEIAWGTSEPASDLFSDQEFLDRLAPGATLDGRYRVDRTIGAGGMGVVALATHMALGQQVAIKLLHPRGLASPEIVARFVREARAVVRVRSEHVVKVIDVATLKTGEPYIVMEYLRGRDARALLDAEEKLSVTAAADLVGQACLGVGEAHRAGIVHRDLKPANLFVVEGDGVVKVLDFGISKVRRDDLGAADVSLTHSTSFLGTPLYMSPEQIRAARDVDARADVWALGCILYELVTGRSPFRRGSLGETCAAILVEDIDHRGVPSELAPILAHCLARDRDERYPDGFGLARALAPLALEGTRAEIERMTGALEAAPRRRPLLAIGAVALVLLGGAAWFARPATKPSLPPPVVATSTTAPVAVARVEPTPSPVVSVAAVAASPPPRIPVKVIVSIPSTAPAPSPSAVVSAPAPSSAKPLNPEFGGRI